MKRIEFNEMLLARSVLTNPDSAPEIFALANTLNI